MKYNSIIIGDKAIIGRPPENIYDIIKKYAPKIIEGTNRLKDWSNN